MENFLEVAGRKIKMSLSKIQGHPLKAVKKASHHLSSIITVLTLVLSLVSMNTAAVFAATNGVMISATNTLPRGAVFLADAVGGAAGGHWWVTDAVLGICRLDPQNVAGQPPFHAVSCSGAAKSGGNIVVGPAPASIGGVVLPAGARLVYVADDASKSVNVVRFIFNPANGGLSSPLAMTVTNPTFVGGGSGGGRAVGLGLAPNGADLYVGYLKSGDIMKVTGANTTTVTNPPIAKIGTTSDGRGVNSLLMFGNDLYLAELGGFGLSMIADPSGVTRAPCTAAAPCKAVTVTPTPSFFPGGLATDGTNIFIGEAQLTSVNSILEYTPATGTTVTYSNSVPTYVSGFDGVSRTTYSGPLGLGYNPATGELYVGDDPTFSLATPPLQQGHVWSIPHPAVVVLPTITAIAPASGSTLGGDVVTITGTNFSTTATTINFGAKPGLNVVCASATSCTATSPAGTGVVDITAMVAGQASATSAADQFTYVAPATNAIAVTTVAPNSGATIGGTHVTITGQNLATYDPNTGAATVLPAINFGPNAATNVACTATAVPIVLPVTSTCTAVSPAGTAGIVDVQATLNAQTSPANPGDQFTYITPVATLYSWGVTAPKGGAVWLPGALGGHWWSSDHAQGLCRQDLVSSAPAPFAIAGNTLHAINFAICASDLVGSAGQAVFDPRPVVNLATGVATTFNYVYVPDNAVKSTAVWRLTFDPATETMIADPNGGALATAMTPLADVRTLKPNGMALGPDGNLYVTDLVEPNVRKITNPNGDPRTQTISIVAVSGDNRGANGTQGFIGNRLYVSGNRAAQFFDITQCPIVNAAGTTPCGMASVPAPSGVFVAGLAADAVHNILYFSDSPGGANANLFRYDASTDAYIPFPAGSIAPDAFGVVHAPGTFGPTAVIYLTGGLLPAPNSPNGVVTCALTCQRPWDQGNHPTTGIPAGQGVPAGFSFAFGLGIDPNGNLAITEDPSAGARSGRGTMWTVPYIP